MHGKPAVLSAEIFPIMACNLTASFTDSTIGEVNGKSTVSRVSSTNHGKSEILRGETSVGKSSVS